MTAYSPQPEFREGALRPLDAFKEGVEIAKSDYLMLLLVTFVGFLIGILTCTILLGPMFCGIYMCYFAAQRREPVAFDKLFRGFDYFLPAFLAALAMVVATIFINIPSWALGMVAEPPADAGPEDLGRILALSGMNLVVSVGTGLIQSFVSTMLMFAFPLIVERGLGAGDALGLSVRASLANMGGILGIVLINFALGIAGALACCIGGIFLLPVQFGMYAIAYRMMFGDIAPPPASPHGGAPSWPPPNNPPYGAPYG